LAADHYPNDKKLFLVRFVWQTGSKIY